MTDRRGMSKEMKVAIVAGVFTILAALIAALAPVVLAGPPSGSSSHSSATPTSGGALSPISPPGPSATTTGLPSGPTTGPGSGPTGVPVSFGPTTTRPVTPNSAPTLAVTMAKPVPGTIQHCSLASGTAANIPAGYVLWLAIQIPDSNDNRDPHGYYLVKQLPAGNWQMSPLEVGSSPDKGRPYWIVVELLPSADSPPANNPGGRRALPSAQEEIVVAVRRDAVNDNATGPPDPDYPADSGARLCA
jgi:hypothetical protein